MAGWPRAAASTGGLAPPLISPLLLGLAVAALSGHAPLRDRLHLLQDPHLEELVAAQRFGILVTVGGRRYAHESYGT